MTQTQCLSMTHIFCRAVGFVFTALALGTYRLDSIIPYCEDQWLVGES